MKSQITYILILFLMLSGCKLLSTSGRKDRTVRQAKRIEKKINKVGELNEEKEKKRKIKEVLFDLKDGKLNKEEALAKVADIKAGKSSPSTAEPSDSEGKAGTKDENQETNYDEEKNEGQPTTNNNEEEGEETRVVKEPEEPEVNKENEGEDYDSEVIVKDEEDETKEPTEEVNEEDDGDTVNQDADAEDKTELEKRLKKIEDKIKRDSLPKFSISPDRQFYSFAVGANFDLLDGVSSNSLYSDLLINLRGSKRKYGFGGRISFQLGTTRGRNTSLQDEDQPVEREARALRETLTNPVDSTVFPRWIVYDIRRNTNAQEKVDLTTAYGRINYRLTDRNTKLYLTGQLEYGSFRTETTTVTTINTDTTLSPSAVRDIPVIQEPLSLSDTTVVKNTRDYFLPGVGLTLFNENKNFDVSFTLLAGPRIPLSDDDNIDGAVILTQATILDKKVIGAKLGFEMRYFYHDDLREPSYFFFISKQFSLQEFFKVFAP